MGHEKFVIDRASFGGCSVEAVNEKVLCVCDSDAEEKPKRGTEEERRPRLLKVHVIYQPTKKDELYAKSIVRWPVGQPPESTKWCKMLVVLHTVFLSTKYVYSIIA